MRLIFIIIAVSLLSLSTMIYGLREIKMESLLPFVSAQVFFPGTAGQNGTQGPPGETAIMDLQIRHSEGEIVPIDGIVESTATCNLDEKVSGGGYIIEGAGIVLRSSPRDNSWVIVAADPFNMGNSSIQSVAECAKLGQRE